MSVAIEPMKAQPAKGLPSADGYIMETKYDGWRGTLHKRANATELFSSTGKPITSTPYILTANLAKNMPDGTILDGEIVNLNGANDDQWKLAQSVCSRDAVHVPSADEPALTFMVFDVLELMGNNVRTQTLERRKELLSTLFDLADGQPGAFIQLVPTLPVTDAALAEIIDAGWEGVVCKRLDSPYQEGSRGPAWLKIKPNFEIEATCTGMYPPENGSKYEGNAVGGFEFTVIHPDGRAFQGRCGTGMDNATRERMATHAQEFIGRVVELKHWGVQPETGALRFPSLKRFRDPADKPIAETQVVSNAAEMSGVVEQEPMIVQPPTLPEPPAPEPAKEPTVAEQWALERMLDLESENTKLKAEVADLRIRLDATLRGTSMPNSSSSSAQAPSTRSGRLRNYKAMGAPKLRECLRDLRAQSGPNYEDAVNRGDPARALRVVERIAKEKGITV